MRLPRKGDRLVYTGEYDVESRYPPGVVEGFRKHKTVVIVKLEADDDLWADWPVDEIAPAPSKEENK